MPSRLQNLLGIAPLENLRNKYKNPLDSMNTDLENQVGFNQGMGPLNSANPLQPPAGSFYQNQIQNQGLQNPFDTSIDDSFGGDSGTGDFSAGDLGSIREKKHDKFYTSPEALMEQFFSGLAPSEKSQYQTFTADNILDIEELGALMGFNIDDIRLNKIPEGHTKGLRDLLETMGLEKYSDFFQGTGEKLRNLQELRSGKFKSVRGKAGLEAGSVLSMTQAGSTTGAVSGRRQEAVQEGVQTLENVLENQLMGAEGEYFGQLDALLQGTVGQLREGLDRARSELLTANPDYGQYTEGGTGTEAPGEQPDYSYIPAWNALNDQGLADVQQYITGYFNQYSTWPTETVVSDWVNQYLQGQTG